MGKLLLAGCALGILSHSVGAKQTNVLWFVVDDMSAAAKPILAEAKQDARPAKRFDARYADCESKARLF